MYQSVQTSNSGTTSVTVTKPTSLAVGDLMIAHVASSNAGAASPAAHSLAGWTELATDISNSGTAANRATALYKFADSGDTAASDFTFSSDANSESICGAIFRFAGAGALSGAADDDPATGTNHTYTNSITPTYANSEMLLLISCASNGGSGTSSHAITTDNPTWTERYDTTNAVAAGDGDTSISGATASRPEVTATGNSTATTGSVTDSVGIIVAIYPAVNASVSPSVLSVVSSVQTPVVSAGASVTTSVVSVASSIIAPTVSFPTPNWTNTNKNGSAWTNQTKS